MKKPVYLDYNATTPLHPEVAEEMRPYLSDLFGNPSSAYSYGAVARTEVERARARVASLLGCKSHEIIFTSGGTESNNLAIKGIAAAYGHKGKHIITSRIEHPAVAEVCNYLEQKGFRITRLGVDEFGMIDPDELEAAISASTILITIMHANNEIGTIQPVQEIARLARENGIIFHTDAAQTAGKIPVDDLGADLVSIAGHKLYGPKGVGALYIREGVKVEKLLHGADHEQHLRPGTENIMSVAGLGKACEVAQRDLEKNRERMKATRDLLAELLRTKLSDFWLTGQSKNESDHEQYENIFWLTGQSKNTPRPLEAFRLNGHPEKRLPNTLNISLRGVEAGLLLPAIANDVAASAGAACHAAEVTLSPTLEAIGVPAEFAAGTIRFSTGRLTTPEEVEFAAEVIANALKQPAGVPVSPEGAPIRLTHFTQGLGCACKLNPQLLQEILAGLPARPDKQVLVGPETFDDAAVYKISESMAIVQTVDFFTPIVDDPYDFGSIAAANALSDIYAMGAVPVFALNIAGFPSTRLSPSVLQQILKGAADKAAEAGISILGGHTVDDLEPKFGMVVTGTVDPARIVRNSTARPGDVLVLTKKIGTGILATALKRGLLDAATLEAVTRSMAALNRQSAEIMMKYPVNACTDVTGFGLLGHLAEMTSASRVVAEVDAMAVPLLPRVEELAAAGIVPGGSQANLRYLSGKVDWQEVSEVRRIILCDAQTSGGLLIAVPEQYAAQMAQEMEAVAIGRIVGEGQGLITVAGR